MEFRRALGSISNQLSEPCEVAQHPQQRQLVVCGAYPEVAGTLRFK